jgi:hypothetical protein
MRKNIIKISLDIIMTVILVLLYNSHVFSIAFHEIAGLFIGGLFIIHCLLNKKWIVAITTKFFSKALAPRVRFGYIINFLLLITFCLLIVSGILTSQVVFPKIAVGKSSPWQYVHQSCAEISIILVGVHIGLHWGFISGMFKRVIKIPASIAKPLCIVFIIGIMIFGSYSIVTVTNPDSMTETSNISENESPSIDELGENDNTQTENETAGSESNHTSKQDKNKGGQAQRGVMGSHPEGAKKGEDGSPTVVLNTFATYLSILATFVIITYYIDKLLSKKRKTVGNSK